MCVRPRRRSSRRLPRALARVPKQPLFGADFEIDRGRSSLDVGPGFLQPGSGSQMSSDPGVANWVRIRREFSVQALFSTVQYSFSSDPKNMVETLVFRVRDPKDLMQVSIEDSASAVTSPDHHALDQHARQPGQAGTFRQVVDRAGAMLCDRRQVRRRIRAPTSRCFRARPSVLSNYRGLLERENHGAGGVGTAWERRTEAKPKRLHAKKPAAKKK